MSEHRILKTEMRNPNTTNRDRMTTAEMLECIQRERSGFLLPGALKPAASQRTFRPSTVAHVSHSLRHNRRLHLVLGIVTANLTLKKLIKMF